MKKVQEGCGVVGQFSPGRASRGSCQSFTWVETDLLLPQALPYMCLARPGPCAVVPARMPQARPCRPMRSGRQGERRRCRHAWPHTPPSRPAGGLGLPGCVGALCQASCEALGPVLRLWRWRGVCWQPGVLRGGISGPGCLVLLPAACN